MRKDIVVVILVLAAAVCWAGTTGKLTGTVADNKGLPLPGVTITIESPALIGGPRTLATEADGSFLFPAIAPGVYTIKASLQGFVTQERSQVEVRLDHTTTLQINIPQAKFGEEIKVVAETPVVDRTQASASQTFTDKYLQQAAVSSDNRSYQAVLNQAAGVAAGMAGANVFGSTVGENAYLIDGLDSTDPATGTAGTSLNFDVIEEISFQSGGFEAEYGRATGGVVNLITKSGGNTFSGTFDLRYRSTSFNENGDHFNKDAQTVSFVKPAATLGGPILRDKVWFFLGYEQLENKTTPAGSPTTSDQVGQNWMAKVTWQPNTNWRIVAKTTGNPNHVDNADASPFNRPEATGHSRGDSKVNQLEALATLTPNLLWNIQIGKNADDVDYYPQSGNLTTIGHVDLATQIHSVNYFNAQYSTRDRNAGRTSLTYLVDHLGGSHEFKAGLEYDDTKFDFHSFLPGGYVYGDRAGQPYVLLYATDSGAQNYKGKLWGGYLQDAWRPVPNLTLKLGVRFDTATYDSAAGTQIADLKLVQPRIGAAWDVTGDGKTVARASFGRFMHPASLTLPLQTLGSVGSLGQFISCTSFFGSRAVCEGYAGSIGTIVINDPSGGSYPGEGWMLTKPYAPTSARFDSGLKPTYADEWVLGVEHEVLRRTSIGLGYVHKDTKDIIENTCNGNWPGPPSAGAPCSYLITANLPGLERNYRGWVLQVESRATDWLHILASYTYSTSKGNVEYTQYNGTDFDVYPYNYQNRYGYLSDDRRHRLKINGYAQLPYEFTVGLSAYFESAFRWTPLKSDPNLANGDIFLEPRGSRSGYSDPQMDLQVSKRFRAGDVRLELIGSILNVLSSEKPTAVCQYESGCGAFTMGQAVAWQQPRRYEAGLRIEF